MTGRLRGLKAVLGGGQSTELLRFLVVGFSVVSVDFAVYFLLIAVAGNLPVTVAKTVSFLVGAALAFVLNRTFVFRATGTPQAQIPAFAVLYACSLGLNTGVNWTALRLGAPLSLAWLMATGASTVSNFLGMKLIVFRRKGLST